MKPFVYFLLAGLFGLSCQPGNRDRDQSPDIGPPVGDSLWKDSISDDAVMSKDTLKTTDSLQSPSFP